MKRIIFYIIRMMAFVSRMFSTRLYMKLLVFAHKTQGVNFSGMPEYIQLDAYLDPSGGLTLAKGVVISTRVIILTHDWSFLKRCNTLSGGALRAHHPVEIGEDSFIGAGAIVLPGTTIGRNCIIGAGAVVKGKIEDYSIIIGNPAKKIGDTRN